MEGKMGAVVIYYSLEGNTEFIAKLLSLNLEADIIKLEPRKEIPKKGLLKYIIGGLSAILHHKPELSNERIPLDKYDTVILGTPIWAGTYSTPINTFLSEYKMSGKNIILFACHSGSGANKAFNQISKELEGNKILHAIDFVDPVRQNLEQLENRVVALCNTI